MIELGPVNFHIVARNETEQRIAHYHVRTARLLLGQLKAVAGNVGLQSRKVRTEDGTEITVMRNMNPYTGQAVCSASIRPRSAQGAQERRDKRSGPFMWIGLKDLRTGSFNDGYGPFMSIWAPFEGEPGKRGGRALIPSSGRIIAPQ